MIKTENIILETAQRTIQIEAETLIELKNALDVNFIQCVKSLFECQGRLIVSGIGKTAIVAQKIVATLNSTGTPAIFMHAADAIHGDLGMVRPMDHVLCISKSGETTELRMLASLVKGNGNVLIGMVSNKNSSLARQSDFVLYTPILQEADPNNLAPTASTTSQMAMGDALATALLALRGFTPNDFAQFHPGGTLGKQLYLKVSDVYPRNQKPEVFVNDKLDSIILEMTAKCLGATAVLDKENQLVGIITDGDLRRMLKEKGVAINSITAADIMGKNPKTIRPHELAVQALQMLNLHSITQLIVADDTGRYLGIIHLHDLIREGLV